jgi:hypothetical protein
MIWGSALTRDDWIREAAACMELRLDDDLHLRHPTVVRYLIASRRARIYNFYHCSIRATWLSLRKRKGRQLLHSALRQLWQDCKSRTVCGDQRPAHPTCAESKSGSISVLKVTGLHPKIPSRATRLVGASLAIMSKSAPLSTTRKRFPPRMTSKRLPRTPLWRLVDKPE